MDNDDDPDIEDDDGSFEFTDATAGEIYTGQGIDSIDEWANFDEDNVVSLLQTVRKLGKGGDGEMISYKLEMNLQAAVFFIHHKHRTRRTVDYANITVPRIRDLRRAPGRIMMVGKRLILYTLWQVCQPVQGLP